MPAVKDDCNRIITRCDLDSGLSGVFTPGARDGSCAPCEGSAALLRTG